MSHNFDAQRRETFNTFRDMPKGMKKLPERAEVDFLFYPEEHDANYGAVIKALTAKGYRCSRDDDLVVAKVGPIPVTPEAHGLDAKTFSRTIAPLFAAKGMLMFKDPATDEVKAAYALKTSVTHKPWPKALPPEASYLDAFLNEALDSLIGTFNQS